MKFFLNIKNFLCIFFILLNYSNEQKEELRWAFEIFRHGARTPYGGMFYSNSNYYDCFNQKWIGVKELTGVGLRQHFLVGYRNRLKYMIENRLISEQYDPREVYLISTDSNRTIMSANAQVQGLYLPQTGPSLSKEQAEVAVPPVKIEEYDEEKKILDEDNYTVLPNRMNIMPIHNFFTKEHFIQLQDKKVCPNAAQIYDNNQNRKEVVDFLNNMTDKYGKNLAKILIENKYNETSLKNYTNAYNIFDTIIAHYTEGNDYFNETIVPTLNVPADELLNDSFKFFEYDLIGNGINNDEELCLHSMSPIFDRLIKWMNLKIEKDTSNLENYTEYDLPKFVMFSTHDSTCGTFMGFMKALFKTDIRYPYFATNINLELIRKGEAKKENYYVKYIINDEEMGEYKFTEFEEKFKNKRKSTDEINVFCGFTKTNEKESTHIYLIVNIILSVISLALIALIFFTIKKKKKAVNDIDVEKVEPLNRLSEE